MIRQLQSTPLWKLVLIISFASFTPLNSVSAHGLYSVCMAAFSNIHRRLEETASSLSMESVYPAELLRTPYHEMASYNAESSLWRESELPDGTDFHAGQSLSGVSEQLFKELQHEMGVEEGTIRIASKENATNSFAVSWSGKPLLVFNRKAPETTVRHERQHLHDWQLLRDYIIQINGKVGDPDFRAEAGRRAFIATNSVLGLAKLHIETRAVLEEFKHNLDKLRVDEHAEIEAIKRQALESLVAQVKGVTTSERTVALLEDVVSKAGYPHATALWQISEIEGKLNYEIDEIPKAIEYWRKKRSRADGYEKRIVKLILVMRPGLRSCNSLRKIY